jgi:hypothetical protein
MTSGPQLTNHFVTARLTPGRGDFSVSNFHPDPIPGNRSKTISGVRRSWRGNGVACFWATSLDEIIAGVIAIISFPPGGGCSSLPCRGVLSSVGSTGGIGQ